MTCTGIISFFLGGGVLINIIHNADTIFWLLPSLPASFHPRLRTTYTSTLLTVTHVLQANSASLLTLAPNPCDARYICSWMRKQQPGTQTETAPTRLNI